MAMHGAANTDWLFWIILYPLLGAAINGIVGHKLSKRTVTFIALAAPAIALFWVLATFFPFVVVKGLVLKQTVYEWITVGTTHIKFSLVMDELSGVMALIVTFVGFLIHVYSVGYMHDDPAYSRYFAYLNLFMFAMLTLVLADNLLVMFIGWEGVGLCSYLLIGFWYTDEEKAQAGLKAFITNRIGDFGFIVAIFIFFYFVGSVEYDALRSYFANGIPAAMGSGFAIAAGLLLFLGATGKSAQIPLYVWLPDAMAGPTPVSALIHAATMVTAGVYMVARLNFFYVHVPEAMAVIAFVGALTALFAATMGFFQNDIKKVLAYSTVSQLGYMFMGVGVGAWAAGVFHLFTHAFFKALLFLGSGSVIHAMSGIQDMRKMGGLKKKLPITYWTFAIATFTIAGFPPAAAFFSKDEILWRAFATHSHLAWLPYVLWGLGFAAAFGTAFYMYRLLYMTFDGESRAPEEVKAHIHESPPVMTVPLIVLAFFSLVVGFLGLPHFLGKNLFEEFLFRHALTAHVEAHGPVWLELTLMGLSVAAALGGFLLARAFYKGGDFSAAESLAQRWRKLHTLLANKYYVDEIYFFAILKPIYNLAVLFWRAVDAFVIDRIVVDGSARTLAALSVAARALQNGKVQAYLVLFLVGLVAVLLILV